VQIRFRLSWLAAAVAGLALVLGAAACGGSEEPVAAPAETETTESAPAQAPPATATQETKPARTPTTTPEPATTPKPTPAPKPKPQLRTVTIVVEGGRPQGGIKRPSVKRGERVAVVVRSDVADEVHLHGYDLKRDVAAGGTARIVFTATVPGRFEVELESRGIQLAELEVRP
jgi:hypothetical protein